MSEGIELTSCPVDHRACKAQEGTMIQRQSATGTEIPFCLIPEVIASQIRKHGDKGYRISVERTVGHNYTISFCTRSLPEELRAQGSEVPSPPGQPFINRYDRSRDNSLEGERV
jgi:hypothetical protein